MNRQQRRRYQSNFRRSAIETLPRADNDHTAMQAPCDWPGCSNPWAFVTMAKVDGIKRPVARRCPEHKVG